MQDTMEPTLDAKPPGEAELLRLQVAKLRQCLAFFASVIRSGELWTPACERAMREALGTEDQQHRPEPAPASAKPAPFQMPSPEQMRRWAREVLRTLPGPPGPGETRLMPDPHRLRMQQLPEGWGPWDRWELFVEDTGLLLASGPWPYDGARVRRLCEAYHKAIDAAQAEAS